jgi:VanZ family protein
MMTVAVSGTQPLAATVRMVAAVGALVLTLAILLGGRVPEAVHLMSRFPDKLLHALAYGLLAGCWCVALGGRRRALAIAMAVVTGLLDEWLQRSIPGRQSDVADLVADGVGATIGAWLALPVVGRLLSRTTRRP